VYDLVSSQRDVAVASGPGNQQTTPHAGVPFGILLTDTELLNDRTVPLNVILHEVVEQAATLTDQLQ